MHERRTYRVRGSRGLPTVLSPARDGQRIWIARPRNAAIDVEPGDISDVHPEGPTSMGV